MVDTNICIYAINDSRAAVRRAIDRHDGRLCVSAITAMELAYGTEKSAAPVRNRLRAQRFLGRCPILDFDLPAAADAGRLRAQLARDGTPIGPYDAMIAGHARSRGLILVTHNTREFARVPGLRLEDWTAEAP